MFGLLKALCLAAGSSLDAIEALSHARHRDPPTSAFALWSKSPKFAGSVTDCLLKLIDDTLMHLVHQLKGPMGSWRFWATFLHDCSPSICTL